MRRMEQAQGLKLMKFEEVYARTTARLLSQAEAAEVLGASERTFRRWRGRCEADGAEGLYDRRLSRVSVRRAPLDEVARALALFDTRCWDFTAKHFREKLVALHGCKRSGNWVRLTSQAHGRTRAAPRRGAHRRKRPRRVTRPRWSQSVAAADGVGLVTALRRPGLHRAHGDGVGEKEGR